MRVSTLAVAAAAAPTLLLLAHFSSAATVANVVHTNLTDTREARLEELDALGINFNISRSSSNSKRSADPCASADARDGRCTLRGGVATSLLPDNGLLDALFNVTEKANHTRQTRSACDSEVEVGVMDRYFLLDKENSEMTQITAIELQTLAAQHNMPIDDMLSTIDADASHATKSEICFQDNVLLPFMQKNLISHINQALLRRKHHWNRSQKDLPPASAFLARKVVGAATPGSCRVAVEKKPKEREPVFTPAEYDPTLPQPETPSRSEPQHVTKFEGFYHEYTRPDPTRDDKALGQGVEEGFKFFKGMDKVCFNKGMLPSAEERFLMDFIEEILQQNKDIILGKTHSDFDVTAPLSFGDKLVPDFSDLEPSQKYQWTEDDLHVTLLKTNKYIVRRKGESALARTIPLPDSFLENFKTPLPGEVDERLRDATQRFIEYQQKRLQELKQEREQQHVQELQPEHRQQETYHQEAEDLEVIYPEKQESGSPHYQEQQVRRNRRTISGNETHPQRYIVEVLPSDAQSRSSEGLLSQESLETIMRDLNSTYVRRNTGDRLIRLTRFRRNATTAPSAKGFLSYLKSVQQHKASVGSDSAGLQEDIEKLESKRKRQAVPELVQNFSLLLRVAEDEALKVNSTKSSDDERAGKGLAESNDGEQEELAESYIGEHEGLAAEIDDDEHAGRVRRGFFEPHNCTTEEPVILVRSSATESPYENIPTSHFYHCNNRTLYTDPLVPQAVKDRCLETLIRHD